MKDNIGNTINIGDFVFCFSGQNKNTIQQVTSYRYCNGETLSGVTEAVNFEDRGWISATNVVSLNALGVDVTNIRKQNSKCDAVGNPLCVGDKVLYLHSMEMFADIGIVKSISEKSCLLSIKSNRFRQDDYRKKHEELISLTALGIEELPSK